MAKALRTAGYGVRRKSSGTEGLIEFGRLSPDVVVLAWTTQDLDPLQFVASIRRVRTTPIVAITTEDVDESVALAAFEAGADCFIPAPSDARLIVARCEALLRLVGPRVPQASQVLDAERHLVLDEAAGLVHLEGEPIELTATEYALLVELAADAGRLVTREEIAHRVWEEDGERDARLIDPHISRLRAKIELDPSQPELLRTVRGRGYRLDVV